ncbi:MAG: hypothetical protein QG670_411, partial [Thermoproteota archaeon]|nr:hypothetical protein [Thermoproteota archaeon]
MIFKLSFFKVIDVTQPSKKSLIIRDPIHGFIRLDHYPFIEEIIDTTYF